MTNPESRPLSREDVPGNDEIRERIDAADREAEAAVARAESEHDEGHGAAQQNEAAEDVSPDTPAPEPPD